MRQPVVPVIDMMNIVSELKTQIDMLQQRIDELTVALARKGLVNLEPGTTYYGKPIQVDV